MTSDHPDLISTLQQFQLNDSDVLLPVSNSHIQEISRSHCRDWRLLPVNLYMKDPLIWKDIERSSEIEEERRFNFFLRWQGEKGSEATYKSLINALLMTKCVQDAQYVCNLVKSTTVTQSEGIQSIPEKKTKREHGDEGTNNSMKKQKLNKDAKEEAVIILEEGSARSEEKDRQQEIRRKHDNEVTGGMTKKLKLDNDYERAKTILEELGKARIDGKDRHDKTVLKLEKEMCEILHTSQISEDKSLDEVIGELKACYGSSRQLQVRESQSDRMLLQIASGGLALRGVFLTRQTEDLIAEKDYLIEVPENVVLTGASQCEEKIIRFSSTQQERTYKKKVDILGCGAVAAASASNPDASISHQTEDGNTHQKEMYSSTVKHSIVQLASYSFEKEGMKLSKAARNDLKKVSIMLTTFGAENESVQLSAIKARSQVICAAPPEQQ